MVFWIIYRPVKQLEIIRVEMIAIGPRKEEEAYYLAAKRISEFFEETNSRYK